TGVTLEQGKRYTLNLKIKTPKFAASNIYWNGQALTFDEYEKTPHAVKQEKQGVLFKWGSLIGLSVAWVPLKPNNPSTFPQWNANRAVYVPDSNTANPTWTKMAAGSTYSDWHNIPFVQGLDSKYGGVRSRYLTAMGADSVAFYKGDICQYLNSDYRMPSGGELGSYTSQQATEDAYSFFMSSTPVRYTYEEGKFLIANGATLKINSFYFPASGYRSLIDPSNPNQTPYGDGEFVNVHEGGYYWSSSPENDSRANLLTFGYQLTTRLTNEGRGNACSVRCVKKN
ncbi:MAG: hypothetical protein LBH19_01125, partial [Dysgonamonadaceae bacterium]|nr:hypothetical protein [Dysgonamonadaceae bacterium]